MKNILITGGTGLIGKELTKVLQKEGHKVTHLSRFRSIENNVKTYVWDLDKKYIEPEAFNNVNVIIHLAGAGIADGRWTEKRKKDIINSRVDTCNLLFNYVKEKKLNLDAFISASGTGYYGANTSPHIYKETDQPATDFLGETCVLWEEAADKFSELNIRVVKIRTGIVLSKNGGALEKMVAPVRLYLGAPLGSGKQYMPWIHLSDLVNIYVKAIADNTMQGAYNAVAPEQITNKEFNTMLAEILKKPLFLPAVPSGILNMALGEMSKLVLEGSRVSDEKLQKSGFKFKYRYLNDALKNLLGN